MGWSGIKPFWNVTDKLSLFNQGHEFADMLQIATNYLVLGQWSIMMSIFESKIVGSKSFGKIHLRKNKWCKFLRVSTYQASEVCWS